MPARTPTIYDVARKAGVSVSTVSRAVNTPHLVQEETRQRVMRAVEQLKFVPKAEASVLARKHVGQHRRAPPVFHLAVVRAEDARHRLRPFGHEVRVRRLHGRLPGPAGRVPRRPAPVASAGRPDRHVDAPLRRAAASPAVAFAGSRVRGVCAGSFLFYRDRQPRGRENGGASPRGKRAADDARTSAKQGFPSTSST